MLVVDMPPGTGDVAISLGQLLPRAEAVVVTTPQPLAQEVAIRAAMMAQKTNMRLVGVVENMSGEVFGTGGGERSPRSSACRCSARSRSTRGCARRRRGRAARLGRPESSRRARSPRSPRRSHARPAGFKPLPLVVVSGAARRGSRALGFADADAATLADHFSTPRRAARRATASRGSTGSRRSTSTRRRGPARRRRAGVRALGRQRRARLPDARGDLRRAARRPAARSARRRRRAHASRPGMLGYWVRRLADGGLVAALTATSPPRLAPSRRRPAAHRDEPARDRDPELRRATRSSPTSRWGRRTYGEVLAGLAAREDSSRSAATRRTRRSRSRSACSCSSTRSRGGSARCSSSRGRSTTRCRRCARSPPACAFPAIAETRGSSRIDVEVACPFRASGRRRSGLELVRAAGGAAIAASLSPARTLEAREVVEAPPRPRAARPTRRLA